MYGSRVNVFCFYLLKFSSGTFKVKAGLAQMAKGGIIMDVTTPEEARIAEEAGVSWFQSLWMTLLYNIDFII